MENKLISETKYFAFDQYQRYEIARQACELIEACQKRRSVPRLLDVGGFFQKPGGAAMLVAKDFFKGFDVTVSDIVDCREPGYVRTNGKRLPFKDSEYDYVICMDVLEHLKEKEREGFLEELTRVSAGNVILACPVKRDENTAAERILFEFIKYFLGTEHTQLKEHLENGLPAIPAVDSFFKKKKLFSFSFNYGNTNNWLSAMLVKHLLIGSGEAQELSLQLDFFYNTFFFGTDFNEPCYRTFWIVPAEEPARDRVTEHFSGFGRNSFSGSPAITQDSIQKFFLLAAEMVRGKNKIGAMEIQLREELRLSRQHSRNLEAVVNAREKEILNFQFLEKEKNNSLIYLENKLIILEQDLKNKERLLLSPFVKLIVKLFLEKK